MIAPIAIIGDRFMLPSVLEQAVRRYLGESVGCRTMEQSWPDHPMEHGYADSRHDGLKECFGDPAQVIDFIGQAQIALVHLAPFPRWAFENLPNLQLLGVARGGPVSVDLAAAHEHGVLVVNTPGRNASAVAEFTIGAILAETRLIRVGHESMRQGLWRGDLYRADRTGRELSDLTTGVIGYGQVGRRVVSLLRPFGGQIVVCDPYAALEEGDRAAGVRQVDLPELLRVSEVVTLHSRVTSQTSPLLDREAISLMRPDSILINTSRGAIVDYEALYQALSCGRIAGAMLDTFAIEPPADDWPLLQLPNVTLTPHIAGASTLTINRAADQLAEEVERFLAGSPPCHPCF